MIQPDGWWRVPLGPVNGVCWMTLHAMQRFMERTGTTGSASRVIGKIEIWLRDSKEVQLRPQMVVKKMMNHQFKSARYFFKGKPKSRKAGFIMVVQDGVLLTVHRNDADEWDI